MGWVARIRNLGRRGKIDAEIVEELRTHVEMAVEDGVRSGLTEEEARRRARVRFGNPVVMRERTMGADAALGIESLGRDVKFALRQMRKSPGFAVTAVLTLALGIGATTAVFTLVQQVMLRSLPVAKPAELWRIGDAAECCYSDGYTQRSAQAQNDWSLFSWEAYRLFRANTPRFEELAAFQPGEGNAELALRRAGSTTAAETGNGEYVSGNFFQTFGLSAWRGRLLSDADDREGAAPVAVMSFHTWQEKYGSDPSVVGATYEINGHAFTIAGIAPPGFFGAKVDTDAMPDFWLPLATEPLIAGGSSRLRDPRAAWLDLIGRVRPGTNEKALEAQLKDELHAWLGSHVADMNALEKSVWQKQTLHVTPGGAGVSLMREAYSSDLWLLLAAAVCVLLVACANIANLLLARGLRNRQATALQAALGASRARLVRKALVESVVLAVTGGAAGVGVAYAGARLILHLAFSGSGSWVPVSATPAAAVLLFALGISALTGVAFGMAPAWMTSHAEPIEAMRGAGRTMGAQAGNRRRGVQKALVIAQAAISLVLLSAAAMLGQSLRNMEHENFGFDPAGRYLVSIDPKVSNIAPEALTPMFRTIQDRLGALPGVGGVSAALHAPMTGGWGHAIRIEGRAEPGPRDDMDSGWDRVTPGYFQTFGDKILMGRALTDADDASTRRVAVVNEAFAKRFFGNENPIGQHFGPAPAANPGVYEIVGVVGNLARDASSVRYGEDPMYFVPEAQSAQFAEADLEAREVWSHDLYNVIIWAPGDAPQLQAEVKAALADIDPNLVMYGIEPYSEVVSDDFAQENMIASLTWLFGAIGLVLAAVGLYGITAYGVEQRTSEIGVRMALGANRGSVVAMVLRGAFVQVGMGLALGIPVAIGAGYLIASELYGVRPWDPLVLGGATAVLGLAAVAAAVIPARRAASIEPMQALRSE